MFSWISKSLILVILGLCSWSGYQYQKINSLMAKTRTQAQAIYQLEQNQSRLNQQLRAEQQAVEEQRKVANALRIKSEQSREKVRVILQKEPCGHTAMPVDVINSIKRLQHTKAN